MKKILYIFDAGDWDSRIAVAQGAKNNGHDVVIGLINGDRQISDFKIIPLQKPQHKIGVFSSLQLIQSIFKLIKDEKPNIIHAVTLKYGFFTGLSALSFKNTQKIYTLAGLGYLFRSEDPQSKTLRMILKPILSRVLCRKNTTLIFQNPDDLALMIQKRYAQTERSVLIRGSGVYLDRFTPSPSAHITENPIILMPTRLVHEKGVYVFIKAAQILKSRGVHAKFQIAGGETKHNPKAISAAEMQKMTADGAVEWLGRVNDLPQRLAQATLVVYPSYYGEGIPRVLLEACAAGRAIITTDHAGCREAVHHGENGLLVPIKDPTATANAIETLLNDPSTRLNMELCSRRRAEQYFNIHHIVEQTIKLYGG